MQASDDDDLVQLRLTNPRPKTRADCIGDPRPCPWVGCKYHLFLDVIPKTGSIVFNVGRTTTEGRDKRRRRNATRRAATVSPRTKRRGSIGYKQYERSEAQLMAAFDQAESGDLPTCLLTLIGDETTYTLEETGDVLNVTRERIRQIEEKAMRMIKHGDGAKKLEEFRYS